MPALGGKLTVDVQLPENSEFGPRVMRCRAEVIRVKPREGDEHEVALSGRTNELIASREELTSGNKSCTLARAPNSTTASHRDAVVLPQPCKQGVID